MISASVIKNCLDELTAITKVDFCVQDTSGALVCVTGDAEIPESAMIVDFARSAIDSQSIKDRYFLKIDEDGETQFILTAIGSQEHTIMIARVAVSEIRNLMGAYKEKFDRTNFFQNLMLDNLLLVDIHNRAKKLHINYAVPRAIIMIDIEPENSETAEELLGSIFTSHNGDYLTEVDESSIIIIKSVNGPEDYKTVENAALVAVDMLNTEAMIKARGAYGTIVTDLKNISKSYKEARMALDVGGIFSVQSKVMSYNELGIGRLIYQLPSNLCNVYINEVFKNHIPEDFDTETLATINTFFDNNLNVSETSRKLFIHRNTLVYRIEKIQKTTGLDIRNFDDALKFRIALMVMNYLKFLENKDY